MTILEALSFYAGLVLPPETSERSKKKRIHDVIQMMGLSHAKDTLVCEDRTDTTAHEPKRG